ncbi:MAG: hypothetical protein ACP5IX_03400, partial [Patescibacteria group bacterium]
MLRRKLGKLRLSLFGRDFLRLFGVFNWRIFASLICIFSLLFFIFNFVLAWIEPTAPPPGDNVNPPINTAFINQYKRGDIAIGTSSIEIGTASPFRLYISGEEMQAHSGSGESNIGIIATGAGNAAAIYLRAKGAGGTGETARIYQPAGTGDLYFETNSEKRLVITSSGNVGIGTTAPTARLDVIGTGTTSATAALRIKNSALTENVTVLDNGNVGIGTTEPVGKLHVRGGKVYIDLAHTTPPVVNLFQIRSYGYAGEEPIFTVDSSGNVGIGTTNSGNVGIGTTVPTARLDVIGIGGATSATATLRIKN